VGARGCDGGMYRMVGAFVCGGCVGLVAGAGVDVGADVGLELSGWVLLFG